MKKNTNNNLLTYRIYHYEKNKLVKDLDFKTSTRNKAYCEYKAFCKKHSDGKTYFYKYVLTYHVKHKDGSISECEYHDHDAFNYKNDIDRKLDKEYHNGYVDGKKESEKDLKTKMIDYINTGHCRSEWWNLYSHILDDLEYNLPILIKKRNGYPALYNEKAKKKLGCLITDLKNGYSESLEKAASAMWDNDLKNLLLHVKLYRYHEGFGIIDETDKELVKFDIAWRHVLPIYPGTENDIDYKKNDKCMTGHWNAIWDFMKLYGLALWD